MTAWVEVDLGPGVRAGFSTTLLGNLGSAVGDDPSAVGHRRAAVAAWLGGPVAWMRQVHGAHVHRADRAGDAVADADALVAQAGLGVGVVVADCVPVLLADPGAGLVGAAHAGRRGVVTGVVPAVVGALLAEGAEVGRLRAVVGPGICGECYEVPADLRDEVEDAVPGTASTTSWGSPSLDLPGAVVRQLTELGVATVAVNACTRTDERFFSHRAAMEPGSPRPSGRIAGVVRIAT
jgi:polyphenol oxidase